MSSSENLVLRKLNMIEYRLLTKDKIEDALNLQKETMKSETVAIGVGMYEENDAAEQMKLVFGEIIKDGCSIIAVDLETDTVVGVGFNKMHVNTITSILGMYSEFTQKEKDGQKTSLAEFVEKNVTKRPCLDLIEFVEVVFSRINIFETYGVNGAMELFYIGTLPSYRGKGIGQQLVDASLQFARGLLSGKLHKVSLCEHIVNETVVPEVAFGIFTSRYSQQIKKKLGFNQLFEIRYEDYVCSGRRLSERIGNAHQTALVAAMKL